MSNFDKKTKNEIQDAYEDLVFRISSIMSFNRNVLFVYVLTTVKNTAIDRLRKRNRELNCYLAFDDIVDQKLLIDTKPLPEDLYLHSESLEELAKALESLPEKYKILLESKYILKESDEEIALLLGISEHSVRTYLTRARRQAFNLMEEGFFDETSKAQRKASLEQSR